MHQVFRRSQRARTPRHNEALLLTGAEGIMVATHLLCLHLGCIAPAGLPPAAELRRYAAGRISWTGGARDSVRDVRVNSVRWSQAPRIR